jgi:Na+-transporting NADH:ubiquinone oxidoreductase subunit C
MKKVLTVAIVLCLVCSVVVSAAAVLLRDAQQANKALDKKRNILAAAGLLQEGVSVEKQFEKVQIKAIDFATGTFTDAVPNPETYDQRKASKDPKLSSAVADDKDIAKINRQANYGLVYIVNNDSGNLDKVILPVKGYGLWSTLYGFLALESDFNTVAGLGFYEHAETPGLGGEVDNPLWKAKWPGKKVYDEGQVRLTILKGEVDSSNPSAQYQIDGLSGATLTSKGVDNLIQYWMGDNGYAKFLSNLKAGEA